MGDNDKSERLTKKMTKHVRTLERRLKFIQGKIEQADRSLHALAYDLEETSALKAAIVCMKWFVDAKNDDEDCPFSLLLDLSTVDLKDADELEEMKLEARQYVEEFERL